MNNYLFVVLVVAVGLTAGLGAYYSNEIIPENTSLFTVNVYDSIGSHESILGTGHFTVTVKDQFGVTKAIRQTQNAVVNDGENCIAKMIFGSAGGDQVGNSVCIGAINAGWRFMGLDQDPITLSTDSDLRDQSASAGLSSYEKADVTWNQNSTGLAVSASKVTLRLSNLFTNTGASDDIFAVGLFNSTTDATNSMLSKANFTSVTVANLGTLTVNYDFEVGGGTVP